MVPCEDPSPVDGVGPGKRALAESTTVEVFRVGPRIVTFLVGGLPSVLVGASEIVGVGGEVVEQEFVVAGVFVVVVAGGFGAVSSSRANS